MAIDVAALDRAFNPRTVAVIGDNKERGFMWLNSLRRFSGKLYSVQINPDNFPDIAELGIPNYTSLAQIPEPVDYVIVAVPRAVVAGVVAQCIERKVGGVTLFTAGFAETSTAEGTEIQKRLAAMARAAGMVLIGPNCMGLYNPALGLCFSPNQPVYQGGDVSFASQSGSHAIGFSLAAPENGLKVNKIVSFGNGIVLENADYLEYFAQDPGTRIIGVYVEGLRDGRRFFQVLQRTTPKKPVIIWKGGQTEGGQRATSSHTASLAESMPIWEAVARQAGAILVHSQEEAVDTAKALSYLPKLTGYGCGLTGGAGGQSVSIADAFERAGMRVPALSEQSYRKLESFFNLVGAFYRNPIDMGVNRKEMDTILDILAEDPAIDVIVMQMGMMGWARGRPMGEAQISALQRLKERTLKALVAIPHSSTPYQDAQVLREIEGKLFGGGIPAFATFERAARALKNVADYHRFHDGQGGDV